MANTNNRGYPYPGPADTPDVPRDVEALALAVDADVQGNVWKRWVGTQAEYDAIVSKDPTTLYVVV